MKLTQADVLKVAKLARIELTEAEVEKFRTQLSAVLDYVEQLQEVDTEGIEPTAQVTGLQNRFRKDEVTDCPADEREAALRQAPELLANLVKVKAVFE